MPKLNRDILITEVCFFSSSVLVAYDPQRLYLYGAGAAVDGGGEPVDCPITINQDVDI